MAQFNDPTSKIKKMARRLRAVAACRQDLTDRDVEQFIAAVGANRVWRVFDKITAPRVAAAE